MATEFHGQQQPESPTGLAPYQPDDSKALALPGDESPSPYPVISSGLQAPDANVLPTLGVTSRPQADYSSMVHTVNHTEVIATGPLASAFAEEQMNQVLSRNPDGHIVALDYGGDSVPSLREAATRRGIGVKEEVISPSQLLEGATHEQLSEAIGAAATSDTTNPSSIRGIIRKTADAMRGRERGAPSPSLEELEEALRVMMDEPGLIRETTSILSPEDFDRANTAYSPESRDALNGSGTLAHAYETVQRLLDQDPAMKKREDTNAPTQNNADTPENLTRVYAYHVPRNSQAEPVRKLLAKVTPHLVDTFAPGAPNALVVFGADSLTGDQIYDLKQACTDNGVPATLTYDATKLQEEHLPYIGGSTLHLTATPNGPAAARVSTLVGQKYAQERVSSDGERVPLHGYQAAKPHSDRNQNVIEPINRFGEGDQWRYGDVDIVPASTLVTLPQGRYLTMQPGDKNPKEHDLTDLKTGPQLPLEAQLQAATEIPAIVVDASPENAPQALVPEQRTPVWRGPFKRARESRPERDAKRRAERESFLGPPQRSTPVDPLATEIVAAGLTYPHLVTPAGDTRVPDPNTLDQPQRVALAYYKGLPPERRYNVIAAAAEAAHVSPKDVKRIIAKDQEENTKAFEVYMAAVAAHREQRTSVEHVSTEPLALEGE